MPPDPLSFPMWPQCSCSLSTCVPLVLSRFTRVVLWSPVLTSLFLLESRPAPSIHSHPCTPGSSCLPQMSICLLRYPKVASSSNTLFLSLPPSPLALVGYSFSSLLLTASIIVELVELHWTDPVFTLLSPSVCPASYEDSDKPLLSLGCVTSHSVDHLLYLFSVKPTRRQSVIWSILGYILQVQLWVHPYFSYA